ncbi:RagB/SusD family nutrient uptake outer membrane protein [Chitinophaga sp.]|uniref:RagB/SusD family nutrient uptake outer membrane protein n=1 Tax=Chitinophaga sp. TaxID=1869181 RepID=UPI002618C44A|nr:RagB/SusD family nutrient uptake outer membrane protein [uncultured Chitinophaga sp.]
MKKHLIICLGALLFLAACQKGEIPNLNSPIVDDAIRNGTKVKLDNLMVGLESGTRQSLATYYDAIGVIGREIYRFSASEPRYVGELMGDGTLDNNTFYITNPWAARYRVVRQGNIIHDAVANANYISDVQKKGYTGYTKTIMAYQLLLNLNMTYTNGIRTDVKDPNNIGPFRNYADALSDIAALLDAGKTELTGAEIAFPVTIGATNAADLIKFNRAIAARVAIYRQQWAAALTALNESFFNLNGPFETGYFHSFSNKSGDQLNPLFLPQNTNSGEFRLAYPSFSTDIVPGDDRLAKATLRDIPITQEGLTGTRDVWIHFNNESPVYIIRNEELILIYAEAKIQLNQIPDGIVAINRLRVDHNMTPYAGAVTQAALLNEMLYHRRYSLFGEGHRWIDMRRYNRLNQLPNPRPGDKVWTMFPIPLTEGS